MKIVSTTGDDTLARVFVAELKDGAPIEFVASCQPPLSWREKWVLIVSTLKGCPVGCPICDAGGTYRGKLTAEEIIGQIDTLVRRRFPDGHAAVSKLKIQFARMGDPALNDAVLDVLRALPGRYGPVELMPSISTVAPMGREAFFSELVQIKRRHYPDGRFQMQFSIHTTCAQARKKLVPIRTWGFEEMAAYGNRFFEPGDRRITLNFAPAQGLPLDPKALVPHFSPDRFIVKLTPINPTHAAHRSGLKSLIDPADEASSAHLVKRFESAGFDTILSIGELAENAIGSNCGMYISKAGGYDRPVKKQKKPGTIWNKSTPCKSKVKAGGAFLS
ncbi:MAG: radical SAM protein [Myxococcota bacterium]|nr:radical SAM protein [Myxococcota bacterium]